jgi:hypothetical protein
MNKLGRFTAWFLGYLMRFFKYTDYIVLKRIAKGVVMVSLNTLFSHVPSQTNETWATSFMAIDLPAVIQTRDPLNENEMLIQDT